MNTQENSKTKKYLREEYISRINRVIDYIESNIDKELSLEKLADVASFSQFHFHRIFRAMVGETLNQFIQRIRVEKAAGQLISNPKKSITEIAFDCGFSGSSTFARAFKEIFNVSASQWRSDWYSEDSKIRKTISKDDQMISNIRKDFDVSSYYISGQNQNQQRRIKMEDKKKSNVEVKDLPELNVVYIRHIGPYAGDTELFQGLTGKLMQWAGPRGLLQFPETMMLNIYHDDPKVTDED
ncbi:MAG: AraC family transcriptional regulator, partial [Deltaproteobacteria bacterium]|nr:AraC family transcriptional regulator [Deltaproteobacteria bacterium]